MPKVQPQQPDKPAFVPMADLPAPAFPAKPFKEPVRYSPEIAMEICERLAKGETLRQICRSPNMPDESAVRLWSLTKDHPFAPQYAEARNQGLDAMAEETFDISDDSSNDWIKREIANGQVIEVFNAEHYQRSRLRVDTRKWYLSKMAPKRYGDSSRIEHTGADGGPIQSVALTADITRLSEGQREQLRTLLLAASGPVDAVDAPEASRQGRKR